MELLLQITTGIGLSAACGCRLFVTLLVLGLGGALGLIPVGHNWFSSTTALIVVTIGTVLEVMAFYRPRLDNLMDAVALPTAVLTGMIVMETVVYKLPDLGRWALAILLGGGITLVLQTATTLIRADLTSRTGGINNGVFATIELGAALGIALMVLIEPRVTAIGVLILLGFAGRFLYGYWRKRSLV
jgi:hypothetical protein